MQAIRKEIKDIFRENIFQINKGPLLRKTKIKQVDKITLTYTGLTPESKKEISLYQLLFNSFLTLLKRAQTTVIPPSMIHFQHESLPVQSLHCF